MPDPLFWLLALVWLFLARRHVKLKRQGLLPSRDNGSATDEGPRWAPFRDKGF